MESLAVAADSRARPGSALERPVSGLRRIARISTSLAATQAATAVLGLLFWTLAARQFSVAAVGVAGAAVALMMLLGALGSFGLGTLLIARLPHTPQGDRRVLVRTSLAAAGSLAMALAVLVPLVAGSTGADLDAVTGSPARAVLFGVGTALMAAAIVLDQAVLVLGSGALQLERNVVASATKVAVLAVLAATGATSGMTVFLAWTVGTAVSLPLVAWRTRGGRPLETGSRLVEPGVLRGLGRAAAGHHALNTTLQAPLQLLPLLVLLALSAGENGIFATALQVTGFVFALPYALSVGLFAAAEGDEREVLARMRFTLPLGLGISVLATLALVPLAPYVLSIFGGVYAEQGADILRVLVLAGIPFVVKDHFVALRRVQGRTGQATAVLLGFTGVELAAAYGGAQLAGTLGLCVAWVAVLSVEAVLLGVVLLKQAGPRPEAAGSTAQARPPAQTRWAAQARPTAQTRPPDQAGQSAAAPVLLDSATPPRSTTSLRVRAARRGARLGPGPLLLLMTSGLVAIAEATSRARAGEGGSTPQLLYVLGLAVIFLPAAVAVLLPGVRRNTLLVAAVAMPVLLQLSRVVLYPTRFMFHDELLHANVLRAIDASGQLFTVNPLLPISAYYPGLEIATSAVASTTGLSSHTASVVVLLAARVVLALGVLAVVERLTGSVRAGAVAGVVYACNPQMLFFNSQFSYQTLALPLAVLTGYLILTRRPGRAGLALPLLALGAVAGTHHVTMALLVGALAAWWLVEVRAGGSGDSGRNGDAGALATLCLAGTAMLAVTVANPGNTLGSYLAAIVTSSGTDLGRLARGEQSKELFANTAGVANEPWEQALVLASLALTVLVLLPALLHARGWLRSRVAAAILLSLTALLYPVIPGGHLTRATAEVGDRAAGFVYLGVAFVVGGWVFVRLDLGRGWRAPRAVALTGGVLATVAFLGGVVLGAGPTNGQLPGPFRVSADARSVDADNLAAARWMAANLPDESRVYADRVSGLVASAYGEQFTVRHISTGVDASRLLLSPDFGQADLDVLEAADIDYVVADRRDAFGLPNQAVYIESGEFGERGRTEPVPAEALSKLDDRPGAARIYDNGSVTIYDVRGLRP